MLCVVEIVGVLLCILQIMLAVNMVNPTLVVAPVVKWFTMDRAHNPITNGMFPCIGLEMPLVVVSGTVLALARTTSLTPDQAEGSAEISGDIPDRIDLVRFPSREAMRGVLCGHLAYAFENVGPQVSMNLDGLMLHLVMGRLPKLLVKAEKLRTENVSEWMKYSRIDRAYATAATVYDLPRRWWQGYTPLQLPKNIQKQVSSLKTTDADARGCEFMQIPGMGASIKVLPWTDTATPLLIQFADHEFTLMLGPELQMLTCGQVVDIISRLQVKVQRGLPANIVELRDRLAQSSGSSAGFIFGGTWVTLKCDSGVMAYNSLYVEPQRIPHGSEFEGDISGICATLVEKSRLVMEEIGVELSH